MTGAPADADRAVVNGANELSPPLRASVPSAEDFIRSALITEIAAMLDELGNPALVERIYPNGWRNADRMGLVSLYELCRRTFAKRGTGK